MIQGWGIGNWIMLPEGGVSQPSPWRALLVMGEVLIWVIGPPNWEKKDPT